MKGKITLQKLLIALLFLTAVTHAQAPAVYFAAQGSDMSGIWIEMTTHLGNYCQTAIGYSSVTTDSLEDNHDIPLNYDGPAVLYTKLNNENLAVQTKGIFRTDDVTTLSYKAVYAGTFTLSLTNKTGVFLNGQNVYLRDKAAGTLTNLSQQAYFFTTDAGIFDDRFQIVYTTDAALTADNQVAENNQVIIYRDGNSLNIDAGTMAMSDVRVFDLNGRLIRQSANVGGSQISLDNINAEHQVLLVQIGTGSGTINKKIVF
jgi:trimeric autotransporter adhesin